MNASRTPIRLIISRNMLFVMAGAASYSECFADNGLTQIFWDIAVLSPESGLGSFGFYESTETESPLVIERSMEEQHVNIPDEFFASGEIRLLVGIADNAKDPREYNTYRILHINLIEGRITAVEQFHTAAAWDAFRRPFNNTSSLLAA